MLLSRCLLKCLKVPLLIHWLIRNKIERRTELKSAYFCGLHQIYPNEVALRNYQPTVYTGTIEIACDMHQQPWYYELVNCYMRTLFFLLFSLGNHVRIEAENRNSMAFTVWYCLVLNNQTWFEKFLNVLISLNLKSIVAIQISRFIEFRSKTTKWNHIHKRTRIRS